MQVLLRLFNLGDINSFSIQSSILTRLLQFRKEGERVSIFLCFSVESNDFNVYRVFK